MQARVDNEVGLGHVLPLLKRVNAVKFPQSSNEKETAMPIFTGEGSHHGCNHKRIGWTSALGILLWIK